MDRQFPPEIVQLIVKASLDSLRVPNSLQLVDEDRYPILKRYSILNSTWREACKPSLYKIVAISSKAAASNFIRVAGEQGGKIVGVESMSISTDRWTEGLLAALLKCTPAVRELVLWSTLVPAEDLAHMLQLTDLTLLSSDVISSSSSLTQLPIRRLCTVSGSPTPGHFLTPNVLPNLRELIQMSSHNCTALVPQLYAMELSQYDIQPSLLLAKSLRLLSLDYEQQRDLPSLTNLPPFLLLSQIENARALVRILKKLVANPKTGLKMIFVSQHDEEEDSRYDSKIGRLITQLGSMGVVVEREIDGFDEAIRRMDSILLAEREAAEKREWAGARE